MTFRIVRYLLIIYLFTIITAAQLVAFNISGVTVLEEKAGFSRFVVDFGEFQFFSHDSLLRLRSQNHNYTLYTDAMALPAFAIPVAVADDQEPTYSISVLEEYPSEKMLLKKMPANISFGEIRQFRELSYRLIIIQPALSAERLAAKLEISINQPLLQSKPANFAAQEYHFLLNQKSLPYLVKESAPRQRFLKGKAETHPGVWLEIQISESGIYKVSGAEIAAAGISLENVSPDRLHLYSSPTLGRPYTMQMPQPFVNLTEIPLLMLTANNNRFSSDDAFIFYGESASGWDYAAQNPPVTGARWNTNPYSFENHYWLLIRDENSTVEPLRMESFSNTAVSNATEQNWYYERFHHEKEESNLIQGGIWWYGEGFNGQSDSRLLTLPLDNLLTSSSEDALLRIACAGASVGSKSHFHTFQFVLNDKQLNTQINASDYLRVEKTIAISPADLASSSRLNIYYTGDTPNNKGFLDFVSIIYPATPIANDNVLQIWLPKLESAVQMAVSGFSASPYYHFDISDKYRPRYRIENRSAFQLYLQESSPVVEHLFLDEGRFKKVDLLTAAPAFQPDRQANTGSQIDLAIIYHPDFAEAAEKLADFKRSRHDEPLSTVTMAIQDIYNQYSGGNSDPLAIRNYLYDLYHNAPLPRLRYAIFFGDGTYDYRNISGIAKNFIPQYEISEGSIHHTRNTDDPFVYLSGGNDNTIDLATGRFPVNTIAEANNIVQKIIDYETRKYGGIWQSGITLVADDPTDPDVNYPAFINNTEKEILPLFPASSHFNKIYLTEYPELYDPAIQALGRVGAREDILKAFQEGTLLMNWIGHGSPLVWAQEYIFVKDRDINAVESYGQYPLIVAATCDWGRSDYLDLQSMAEAMINLENNGAIGTIATTRAVYDYLNMDFLKNLYGNLFPNAPQLSVSSLIGDGVMTAKLLSSSDLNSSKFQLLGDPTLRLAYPKNSGTVESVSSDTLKALDKVTFSGAIRTPQQQIINDEAIGTVQLFDSQQSVTRTYKYYQSNIWRTGTVTYNLPGNKLFDGTISISEGQFSTKMIIPKDIRYAGNSGMLRIQYSSPDNRMEGILYKNNLIIQGSSDSAQTDLEGPQIYFDVPGYQFVSGDAVADTGMLEISLSDENGINLTGSTGHDIMLVVNGAEEYRITKLFQYNSDSWQEGKIILPLTNYFQAGDNEFTVRAFDNYNNFNSAGAEISIISGREDILSQVINFPNPFGKETWFTFYAAGSGDGSISIFTLSGKTVAKLDYLEINPGFNRFFWNGLDSGGDPIASGIYLYSVELRYQNKRHKVIGKCVKIPG
jgi:hypothetical protein